MAEKTAYAAEPAASLNGTREDFKVEPEPDNWNTPLDEPEFGLLTLKGLGINQGATLAPAGASVVVALFNGGQADVLWEFLVISVFYRIVAACLAKLAAEIPCSDGVYWQSEVNHDAEAAVRRKMHVDGIMQPCPRLAFICGLESRSACPRSITRLSKIFVRSDQRCLSTLETSSPRLSSPFAFLVLIKSSPSEQDFLFLRGTLAILSC